MTLVAGNEPVNREFAEYLQAVDAEVIGIAGLGRDDLPDFDYWSAFADGLTVRQCAVEVLRNAGEELGFDDVDEIFGLEDE